MSEHFLSDILEIWSDIAISSSVFNKQIIQQKVVNMIGYFLSSGCLFLAYERQAQKRKMWLVKILSHLKEKILNQRKGVSTEILMCHVTCGKLEVHSVGTGKQITFTKQKEQIMIAMVMIAKQDQKYKTSQTTEDNNLLVLVHTEERPKLPLLACLCCAWYFCGCGCLPFLS